MRKFSAAAGFLSLAELLKQEVGQGAGGSSGATARGQTDGGSGSQCRDLSSRRRRVGAAVIAGPAREARGRHGPLLEPWQHHPLQGRGAAVQDGQGRELPRARQRVHLPGLRAVCAVSAPPAGPRGGEASSGLAPTRGRVVFTSWDAWTRLAYCPDLLVGPAEAHRGPRRALELRFFCPRALQGHPRPGHRCPLPGSGGARGREGGLQTLGGRQKLRAPRRWLC